MPLVREYRLVMPMTLEEYQLAQRWSSVEDRKEDLKSAKDNLWKYLEHAKITLLKEEVNGIPFGGQKKRLSIRAEHKVQRAGPLIITWSEDPHPVLKAIRFSEAVMGLFMLEKIKLTEFESWDAFPYFRAVSKTRNQAMFGKSYEAIYESVCLPGNGQLENTLNLPEAVLKKRSVHLIDIAKDVDDSLNDPILYQSAKTGRGPLQPGKWMNSGDHPVMTCYILLTVKFAKCGLSQVAENKLQKKMLRQITLHHRRLFCGMDNWMEASLEELQDEERKLDSEIVELIKNGGKQSEEGQQSGGDGDVVLDMDEADVEEEAENEYEYTYTSRDPSCGLRMGILLLMILFVLLGVIIFYINDDF